MSLTCILEKNTEPEQTSAFFYSGNIRICDEKPHFIIHGLFEDFPEKSEYDSDNITIMKEDEMEKKIESDVFSLPFREDWKNENIQPPNQECKKLSIKIINSIHRDYAIYPKKIKPIIDEGIYILYENKIETEKLKIEIYNDLEIATIVVKDEKVKSCLDARNINQFFEFLSFLRTW